MIAATRPATIAFTVPGRPVPKARARVTGKHAWTPEKTQAYETLVAWHAQLTIRDAPQLKGDISLTVKVYVSGGVYGDIDNYVKSVSDAIQGILFNNDKQVSEVYAVRYACKRGDERIEVVVQERVL